MIDALLDTRPFWLHLGVTLAHFVWQGAIVALVLAAALRMLRRRSPSSRYAACTAILFLMAAGPIVTWFAAPVSPWMLASARPAPIAQAPSPDPRDDGERAGPRAPAERARGDCSESATHWISFLLGTSCRSDRRDAPRTDTRLRRRCAPAADAALPDAPFSWMTSAPDALAHNREPSPWNESRQRLVALRSGRLRLSRLSSAPSSRRVLPAGP